MNDDHYSCFNNQLRLITFDAVDTEKYIVLVAGYAGSESTFTVRASTFNRCTVGDT